MAEVEYKKYNKLPKETIASSTGLDEGQAKEISDSIYGKEEDNFWDVVVVVLDIRNSSIALVNVEDFDEYSNIISDFTWYVAERCKSADYESKVEIRKKEGEIVKFPSKDGKMEPLKENGWFDKFTGDGVILFWRLPDEPYPDKAYYEFSKQDDYNKKLKAYEHRWNTAIRRAVEFSIEVTAQFLETALPDIRKTCGLLPADFGLSVGIDAGRCLLTVLRPSEAFEQRYERYGLKRAGDKRALSVSPNVTAIGRAIIGANRMVKAAKPYEILVNSCPGGALNARLENPKDPVAKKVDFCLKRIPLCIKEYNPVEAYRVVSGRLEQLKKTMTFCDVAEEGREEKEKEISKPRGLRPEKKRSKGRK